MRRFTLIWITQAVSTVGSGMTRFALGVWVFRETGSATLFALTQVAASVPYLLLLPFAGALVDRWDRRRTMLASDCAAAAVTLAVAVLLWRGDLAFWHVCVVNAMGACIAAFQGPAWMAATGVLVPPHRLARASGMVEAGNAGAQAAAPLLAGLLLGAAGMHAVLLADFATFFFAAAGLLWVRIPRVAASRAAPHLWREASEGWRYLRGRAGMRLLLAYFAVLNLCLNMAWVLVTPFVLKFASERELGAVLAVASCGMVAGGIVLSAWGGPPRKVLGTLGGGLLFALCLVAAGVRESTTLFAAASFGLFFSLPIINGCFRVIWQTQTPVELHGRVASLVQMAARWTLPAAFGAAGWLADRVFEPLLMPAGSLVPTVGTVLGTGPGRGTGLLFVVLGLVALLATLSVYQFPSVHRVEGAFGPPPGTPLDALAGEAGGGPR